MHRRLDDLPIWLNIKGALKTLSYFCTYANKFSTIFLEAEGEMANLHRLSWAILLAVLCLAGPLGLATSSSAQTTGNLPADLQALIDEALKANPEVKQMRANYKASKETIKSSGALDDPEIGFTMKDIPVDTWAMNREPMSQKMLEIVSEIPLPRQAPPALRSGRGADALR